MKREQVNEVRLNYQKTYNDRQAQVAWYTKNKHSQMFLYSKDRDATASKIFRTVKLQLRLSITQNSFAKRGNEYKRQFADKQYGEDQIYALETQLQEAKKTDEY